MAVIETPNSTNYKLLTFTAVNNVLGTRQFDFNLIQSKRIVIKRIKMHWYLIDNSAGYPYLNSIATIDGLITSHNLLKANTEKILIPRESGSNKHQGGNCDLSFKVNSKPIFLNGKLENLFIEEDNLNLFVNEPVSSFDIKVTNAKLLLIDNTGALVDSDNIGWTCEIGVIVL